MADKTSWTKPRGPHHYGDSSPTARDAEVDSGRWATVGRTRTGRGEGVVRLAAARRGLKRAGWAGEEGRRTDGEPGIGGFRADAQRRGGRHDVFQMEEGRAGRGVGGKISTT